LEGAYGFFKGAGFGFTQVLAVSLIFGLPTG
jgi:hypothetical protein